MHLLCQAKLELEIAANISHPSLVCTRESFVVWICPKDLLGPEHSENFQAPGKNCLLLVQEMEYIAGRTLDKISSQVRSGHAS